MAEQNIFNEKDLKNLEIAFRNKLAEIKETNTEITKSDITDIMVQTISDIPPNVVKNGSKFITNIVSDFIVQGYKIEFRGFGSITVRYRPPRNAHNPRNGEKVTTLGKFTPHFKTGKKLKQRVDRSDTQTTEIFSKISEAETEA